MKEYGSMIKSVLVIFMVLFFLRPISAQQVITFKDGRKEIVKIIDRKPDTLYYSLLAFPRDTLVILKEQITRITPLLPDSLKNTKSDDYSMAIETMIRSSSNKVAAGGSLCGIGIICEGLGVWAISVGTDEDHPGTIFGGIVLMLAGTAMLIPGTVMLAKGISLMNKYNAQLKGFSFDVNYDARQYGLTLKYKF